MGRAQWQLSLASILINQGYQLQHYPATWKMWREGASQATAEAFLQSLPANTPMAYHFDARKLASYLRDIAIKRGVRHINSIVENVRLDARKHVTALLLPDREIAVDFVIDASGLHRLIIGKSLNAPWQSYAEHLLLNRALPFFIPSQTEHPPLVTRAIAMKHGWMWCIPTLERLGVGYVYCDRYTDKEAATKEVQDYWGMDIEPANDFASNPATTIRCGWAMSWPSGSRPDSSNRWRRRPLDRHWTSSRDSAKWSWPATA